MPDIWRKIKDSLAVSRVFATFTLSRLIQFNGEHRFQPNPTTFLKCISNPENAQGNIFIIQGGVRHMSGNGGFCVRILSAFMRKKYRIFVFEKLEPVINYAFGHDVADCIAFIRNNFFGPICAIGYSMGSILLYAYLSLGYDQADLYIPTCGPLDLVKFHEVINSNPLFHSLQCEAYKCYNVSGYDELLEIAGTSKEENEIFKKEFIPQLNRTINNWINKTIYLLGLDDPITDPNDLYLLERMPTTYLLSNSWHCCLIRSI